MKLRYTYEPEPFDLGDLTYIPDFWLEDFRCYAEVKPTPEHMGGDAYEKARRLSEKTGAPVVALIGLPDFTAYSVMTGKGWYGDYGAVLTKYPVTGKMDQVRRYLENDPVYTTAVNAARQKRFK
jgi:hypothetical protein